MTSDFQQLKSFDFSSSIPHLWVFKDSASAARFRTFYVQTENELNSQIKGFVEIEIARITEHAPYSYIAQTNESSCLTIEQNTTDFNKLKTLIDRLESEHRIDDSKDLKGAKGYVVKFISNGITVYAVKRSTSTWKTSYPKKYINMVFSNGELAGVEDNSFSIEKNFDFYVINNTIFIANKRGFESSMQHREAYVEAFTQLQASPSFSGLFTDISVIIEYVGSNSIQLRRMGVIEEKGIYNNPNFIPNLMRVNTSRSWGINFDSTSNTIVPCSETARTILQVLLDHRLMSEITDNIYDVPDATEV
ncbi:MULTISPECIES: DUF4868 domain-containing protein [Shewanella]|jgi:hypothetical protein|uniref:DUF4868 domain-containing protein n=1 Tax=Shewanella TaxID=22 RepID=UPI000C7D764F|nr:MULTISPECIES: DUF4868 domain-containing protein [Shewanella]AVT49506.1 DUF4868 domain-containing protein [Shewanella baltica]PKI03857.1 DUF4868 domain-containing protein [Shewanella sp. 11B5]|tara:strand:- start:7673 stop:8587 length:915 start_codon:yes stop_codon:yes gene_type:complete